MKKGVGQILIGASGALVASVLFVGVSNSYARGAAILKHADTDVPATTIANDQKALQTRLDDHENRFARYQEDLQRAVEELDEITSELEQRKIRGKATREIEQPQIGENRIYVNSNSDARYLYRPGGSDELNRVLISWRGKEIEGFVRGTIMDERQDVVCKLNADTATELGLTEQKGLAEGVTLRRLAPHR